MLIYTQVFKPYAEQATQSYHDALPDPSADQHATPSRAVFLLMRHT
ncbi:hypothetical protein IHE45_02G004600 [Dioscorea alata]|uniref:Uncharacterized protein n=1 Tax=Dioscorea alata TaxID=55571 RepID=A0ACB7WNG1_DIOAL|nr:hypothetical protein IHE45_02G004600 [Dioscorea alata]